MKNMTWTDLIHTIDLVYNITNCIQIKVEGIPTEEQLEQHSFKLLKNNMHLASKYFTVAPLILT